MHIRNLGVTSATLVAIAAVMWAAACGGQSVDVDSSDAADVDAQFADGSLPIDSGATDSAFGSDAPNTCPPHQVACNGACTDTRFDPSACGTCGNSCGPGEVCASGSCTSTCPSSQAACKDEDGGLRCADALTDNANCGYCGNVCAAGTICSNGKCSLTCGADETKCTAGDGTSFCTNLQTDPDDCNACGNACPQSTNVASTFCGAGKCGVTCNSGALDCNDNPVDGCEVSPTNDRNNCGVCGNICATGAACSNSACTCGTGYNETLEACNGACVDVSRDPTNCGTCGTRCTPANVYQSANCVESACRYSNRAVISSSVSTIAIDDTYLYFVVQGTGIRRVTKGTTAETPVTLIADTTAFGIAVDATTIFWTSSTGIFKCPLSGCVGSPKAVSDLPSSQSHIIVDDTNFYWTLQYGDGINKCPKTGCDDAPVLMTSQYDAAMAVGPSSLFVVGVYYPYNISAITLTDPPTPSIVTTSVVYSSGVAYHAGQIYWNSSTGIATCDPTSCIPKLLAATPTGYSGSIFLAADDTAVVWTADGVHETSLATATDKVIGDISSTAYQVLLDANNVYWVSADGVSWAAR